MQTNTLAGWLAGHCLSCDMDVKEISWKESLEWVLAEGHLRHISGGFFSIVGLSLETAQSVNVQQPVIYQPEIGILGFLLQKKKGHTNILVQAKPEPGNMGMVQAAPSVQATESNYKRLHHGKSTSFLDYFLGMRELVMHVDTLQSEQGTRFLGKYNRNMVAEIPAHAVLHESDTYRWVPVEELCALLATDFQVNTDTRSVLVCTPWRLLAPKSRPFCRWQGKGGLGETLLRSYEAPENLLVSSNEEIAGKLRQMRESFPFTAQVTSLSYTKEWEAGLASALLSPCGSFEIRHFQVKTSEREVDFWDQPLIASATEGLTALLAGEIKGVLHFLFKCRAEIGFREHFQYGPSIQSSGGIPTIVDGLDQEDNALISLSRSAKPLISNLHSDEGGRFYRCVSRYSIMLLDDAEYVSPTSSMSWMNLKQIELFSRQKGFFTNEARSLISMLLAYL
jgi:dTDP-4-dehydro-6-deoxy-alpha-D-glucopyranose 2,3-dehydratase